MISTVLWRYAVPDLRCLDSIECRQTAGFALPGERSNLGHTDGTQRLLPVVDAAGQHDAVPLMMSLCYARSALPPRVSTSTVDRTCHLYNVQCKM